MYILFVLLFYVYGLLFACPLFENVPLSVIQSDKGTSDDPFIPINRGITDREILISITGLSVGYSWFIFFIKCFLSSKEYYYYAICNCRRGSPPIQSGQTFRCCSGALLEGKGRNKKNNKHVTLSLIHRY